MNVKGHAIGGAVVALLAGAIVGLPYMQSPTERLASAFHADRIYKELKAQTAPAETSKPVKTFSVLPNGAIKGASAQRCPVPRSVFVGKIGKDQPATLTFASDMRSMVIKSANAEERYYIGFTNGSGQTYALLEPARELGTNIFLLTKNLEYASDEYADAVFVPDLAYSRFKGEVGKDLEFSAFWHYQSCSEKAA